MVWDLILNRAVKTHDAIHHEDSFPGIGNVSNRTKENWTSWSTKTSTSPPDHPIFRSTNLYKRRLSNSIHNPSNPVNSQASRVPLPPQPDDEVVDLLTEDDTVDQEDTRSVDQSPEPTPPISPVRSPSPETPGSPPEPVPRRSTRNRTVPSRYGFSARAKAVSNTLLHHNVPLLTAMVATSDPQSFRGAIASADREEWIKAMALEMESLVNKNVFELVPLPKGMRAIGCRWAYKTKLKVDGSIEKHKARLVAKELSSAQRS